MLNAQKTATQWELSCDRGNVKDIAISCLVCGQFHSTEDHYKFMADMPSQPDGLIDDLIRMGAYNQKALDVADSISKADLQKALFLKMAGRGNPKRERLVNELIKQAGGLDEAFSAAFGNRSGEFFNDAIRSSQFTRRRFLRNVAIGAALVTMASCSGGQQALETPPDEILLDLSNLEKKKLEGSISAYYLCISDNYV